MFCSWNINKIDDANCTTLVLFSLEYIYILINAPPKLFEICLMLCAEIQPIKSFSKSQNNCAHGTKTQTRQQRRNKKHQSCKQDLVRKKQHWCGKKSAHVIVIFVVGAPIMNTFVSDFTWQVRRSDKQLTRFDTYCFRCPCARGNVGERCNFCEMTADKKIRCRNCRW